MPAKTERQRRFMGAELARARAGKKTRTGMSAKKLSEFAHKASGSPYKLGISGSVSHRKI